MNYNEDPTSYNDIFFHEGCRFVIIKNCIINDTSFRKGFRGTVIEAYSSYVTLELDEDIKYYMYNVKKSTLFKYVSFYK